MRQALKQAIYWLVSKTLAAPSGEPLPTEAQLAWRLFLLDCEFEPVADADKSVAQPSQQGASGAAAQQPKQPAPAAPPPQFVNLFRSASRFAAANAPPPPPQATGKASRAAAGELSAGLQHK